MEGRFIQFVLTLQHGVQHPEGMSIDNKGQLWLCNNGGYEVTIFNYNGYQCGDELIMNTVIPNYNGYLCGDELIFQVTMDINVAINLLSILCF
ncbi:hypothetical protein KUTeg_019685 [Tegillarca granosa]|uniref:SMP-30/Gluconolactonase/LRE-like region domain-containing protein n=1 Tax=Tegillarca granosa TaxID=220873 RepID=A0ABQ9ED97_TEGGR|nr:hypothetical protein KUTeg_019685 [Tegillarca granosa]